MGAIGEKIKQLRSHRKLTMREVAAGIGVPLTTYREWEYGRSVRGDNLVKLANFFGVSVEQLSGASESLGLTTEQRLKRALDDLAIVHLEIKSRK